MCLSKCFKSLRTGWHALKHVAWFAFFLAFYDGFAAFIIPLTAQLNDLLIRQPLDPAVGFVVGKYDANIGLGDILMYCLFMVAAYKGFGRRGAITAFILIIIFDVLVPGFSMLLIAAIIPPSNINTVLPILPAQIFFGPVALVTYLWLARRMPERTMAQWFAVQAALGHKIVRRVPGRARLTTEQGIAR